MGGAGTYYVGEGLHRSVGSRSLEERIGAEIGEAECAHR